MQTSPGPRHPRGPSPRPGPPRLPSARVHTCPRSLQGVYTELRVTAISFQLCDWHTCLSPVENREFLGDKIPVSVASGCHTGSVRRSDPQSRSLVDGHTNGSDPEVHLSSSARPLRWDPWKCRFAQVQRAAHGHFGASSPSPPAAGGGGVTAQNRGRFQTDERTETRRRDERLETCCRTFPRVSFTCRAERPRPSSSLGISWCPEVLSLHEAFVPRGKACWEGPCRRPLRQGTDSTPPSSAQKSWCQRHGAPGLAQELGEGPPAPTTHWGVSQSPSPVAVTVPALALGLCGKDTCWVDMEPVRGQD